MFCLDEEIGARLCFERKQEIRYNVRPFVFSGTFYRLSIVVKRKIKGFLWETTSAEVNFENDWTSESKTCVTTLSDEGLRVSRNV